MTESQIISSCAHDQNNINLENKHQSWHANLNKVNTIIHTIFKNLRNH